MKRRNTILLIFLLLTISLSAQIVYDSIPDDEMEIVGQWWEDLFIFRSFENQVFTYFNKVNFEDLDCYGEKVFVSTIFGKNGELKETKIVKSASPICDSIVYNFVNGLEDWLPGLARGKFVDIPFVFPITFDSISIKGRYSNFDFFNAKQEEYNKRMLYFDFVHSDQYEQKIINDFDFFKEYMAEVFKDSQYVHILTDYKLKRKESIALEFNPPVSKEIHLLIRDPKKDWILYEYNLKKGKVRVPKDRMLILIIYKEGMTPLLQTSIFSSKIDTVFELQLEKYSKGKLLEEINRNSP